MWSVYFFVLFAVISGISSQDDDSSKNKCVVPPKDIIKNGKFKFSGYDDVEQPQAGEKLYSYVMEVTCDPGFTLQGLNLVQCITDKSIDDFPKCIAPCQRKSLSVLSCGTGFDNEESQCLLSNQQEKLTTRIRTDLQCGEIPQVFRTTVSNGTEAKPEDAPWHATIYTKTTKPFMQICGGTIVSTNVVISAAHCFWNDMQKKFPADQFAVAVGKIYRPWDDPNDNSAQKFEVRDIRIPPRFQGRTTNFQDDIAVLILETEIVFGGVILPACLDFDYDFDDVQITSGRKGRVSGFGLTSADGAASQVLVWAELPVVGIEQCIATAEPGFIESITSDKICAGFANGTAVCRGDSGGGLLIPDDVEGSRRYFLRGVVSTAPPDDHLCNVYSVATFTHIVRHERFIQNALNAAPQSQITTTQDPLENFFTIGNPDDSDKDTPARKPLISSTETRDEKDAANSEIPAANPLKNPKKPSKKKLNCDNPPEEDRIVCAALEKIHKTNTEKVIYCDIGPNRGVAECLQDQNKNNKTTPRNDDTSSIGTQVVTEAQAPITNPPPTTTNEQKFGTDDFNSSDEFSSFPTSPQDEPNFDSLNQGGMELPNQRGSNLGGLNQGNRNNGGNQGLPSLVPGISNTGGNKGAVSQNGSNQEGLNKGGFNQGGLNQEGLNQKGLNQVGLNQGGTSQGSLNQGVISQGGLNQEAIYQEGLTQQGNLNAGQQGTRNQIGTNGQITQGGIVGGVYQNLAGQLGLHVGGLVQEPNEGDKIQGVNQGLANQLGLNYGGIKQGVSYQGGLNPGAQAGLNVGLGQSQSGIKVGGINQGGISQGNINQGGISQGGISQSGINQGAINQGGLNHVGINHQGLTQGFLIQPVTNAQAQGSINAGGLNQGPQTVTNQGGQIHGSTNIGGYSYLPPQPIKNNGQIPIYPTLTPTVISVNVEPGPKVDIKPILTHPESSTERIDVKTSVLEQYFVTTEPNYQNNYQPQFWQYDSPHYQHDNQNYHNNDQNWQWQNWQQKQNDWQNWNSQWEHKQEYPHGYYHHTNKYGGHWWQKYKK